MIAPLLGLGVLKFMVIGVVILALVHGASRRRPPPPPPRRRVPPPPPHHRRRVPPPPPPPPPHHQGAVSVGQLIVALIFFPFVVFFWFLASLGELILLPIHLVLGVVGGCLSVMFSLVGASPRRLWSFTGRQFAWAGRATINMVTRLFRYFGLGGLLEHVERSARTDPPGTRRAPAPGAAVEGYPFEDRYRIESHLGSGGSTARLFVVRAMEGHRPVGDRLVLKYFDMGLGSRLEEVIRESRGMQVAKDMGIVLDHRLAEDHFYYVMPYYEGETLTRAAARLFRHLPSDQGIQKDDLSLALSWMTELLRILDGYHRHGVIHKDVKPDNVIVTEHGIRLVDLGLLTPLASALTLTTHGTEYFRDPEMVKLAVQGKRVKDVDAVRFDVYSAGAVLYYILEGSFPACGPLSRFSRPVPMALSWITSRAMAEGDKRYPSISAMRADLEAAVGLADAGEIESAPVSRLPSFGGFDGGEMEVPTPPIVPQAPPAPSSQVFEPAATPIRPALRRGSLVLAGMIAVVIGVGLTALLVPSPGLEVSLTSNAEAPMDAETIVESLTDWWGRAGALEMPPVLLVGPEDAAFEPLLLETRAQLKLAGIAEDEGDVDVAELRKQLSRRSAFSVRTYFRKTRPAGPEPLVVWIRNRGFTSDNKRKAEARFLHGGRMHAEPLTER